MRRKRMALWSGVTLALVVGILGWVPGHGAHNTNDSGVFAQASAQERCWVSSSGPYNAGVSWYTGDWVYDDASGTWTYQFPAWLHEVWAQIWTRVCDGRGEVHRWSRSWVVQTRI